MDGEDKMTKDKSKAVGIIPTNYAKSHRMNADLPHKDTSTNKFKTSPCSHSKESVSSTAEKSGPHSSEESDKNSTPNKKNRRTKGKLEDCTVVSPSTTKNALELSERRSSDDSKHSEEELKPRIVLTFRSEKTGLRSNNMKIVSPDERAANEEAATRRSTRLLGQPDKDLRDELPDTDDPDDMTYSPNRYWSQPSLKRSTRTRGKMLGGEYSDNVLANAIARKEKSYNEATPTQRLITRRIKPTAKVLANREMKLSLQTTNSTRLSSEKSPEEGIQTRRSARKQTPDSHSSGDTSKLKAQKETKQTKKTKSIKTTEDSGDEASVSKDQYLSVDDIKKRLLSSSVPVRKASLKADMTSSHDRENRRFNKLKKKHLSKLGLQAVSEVKLNVSNENLTDDSTMDSTNTDAIVEHLNAQKKQLESEMRLAFQKDSRGEEALEVHNEEQDDEEYEDEDSEVLRILMKEQLEGNIEPKHSDSETSDEEFAYQCKSKPEIGAVTPRFTRKRARLQRVDNSQNSEHSDLELNELSPAGGEEGSAAVAPSESATCIAACLCTETSNVYVAPDALIEPVFCRAVELVQGARVGCSHPAARDADGALAPLRRPSARVPYFLACRLHTAQLRRHLCCPACGLFCTQGTFYQCCKGHLFHLECGVWTAGGGDAAATPGCPHCGGDERGDACSKVRVLIQCSNRQIFLPDQRLQCAPAQMGFPSGSWVEPVVEAVVPASLLPPAPVSLHSLRQRGDAGADYEELLTTSAEQRLAHAIAARALAEQILTKLISGVDLHQPLDMADGGTFLHLAAKHGNLTAVYLLHSAGCRLDLPDAHLHTPLVLAVLALVEKPTVAAADANTAGCRDGVTGSKTLESKADSDRNNATSKNISDNITNGQSKDREEVEKGILQVIKYLVAAGCDINYQGAEGVTALHLAAQHGGRDACAALLHSQRALVDARDLGGWTPLVWAAENKHPSVVRLLLGHGAEPVSTDSEGNSVLHWCVLAGCSASLQLLLDAAPPAAVDTLNPHGDTPLHVAARQDHYACVVILLARGGRTDIRNSSRELAVECARGEARTAISLNMQMSLAVRDRPPRHWLLSGDISGGRELVPVSCVNDVDDATLPADFTYITRHVFPQHIRLHNTLASMQGCECSAERCGDSGAGTAAAAAGGGAPCSCCVLGVRRWYSDGRLVQNFPFRDAPMLFECNETCKCNLKLCPNAVVTRLSRRGATFVRAQVFRCGEARGWGLRALAPVPRGAPVALYCGELLKASAADTRLRDQYMFAMEVKQDLLDQQCEEAAALCVDAGAYGSAARFINHSCRANLAPVRVFTSARDVRAPDIVLFAARDIRAMEEFTFNYGEKFWSVKSKFMHCCCGAPDCRYPAPPAPPLAPAPASARS